MDARLAVGLILAVTGVGCATIPAGTARTLDRGTMRIGLAQEVSELRSNRRDASNGELGHAGLVSVGLKALYGVTDRLELGASVYGGLGVGSSLQAKYALVRAPTPEAGIEVAVATSMGAVGYYAGSRSDGESQLFGLGQLSLLVGKNLRGGSQLIVDVQASDAVLVNNCYAREGGGQEGTCHLLWSGLGAAFAWRLAPGVSFVPAFGVARPVKTWTARAPEDGTSRPIRGTLFFGSLGLLLGGD